jgi:hypothetical protein
LPTKDLISQLRFPLTISLQNGTLNPDCIWEWQCQGPNSDWFNWSLWSGDLSSNIYWGTPNNSKVQSGWGHSVLKQGKMSLSTQWTFFLFGNWEKSKFKNVEHFCFILLTYYILKGVKDKWMTSKVTCLTWPFFPPTLLNSTNMKTY